MGAGVGAAILAQNYVYEMRSVRFWLINAGYVIIGLGVMGTIIGAFQRLERASASMSESRW